MVRHATWGRVAGEPVSVVGWTLRAMAEDLPVVVVTTLGVGLLFALVAIAPEGLFTYCGGEIGSLDFRRRAPASLSHLASRPSAAPWYPVRVRISQRGVRTGYDGAVASFVDGWLVVEGNRTSFSVRPSDVLAPKEGQLIFEWGLEAQLDPFDRIENRTGLRDEFHSLFRVWRRDPSPDGDSVLPPREIHAWAWAKAASCLLWGLALMGGAAMGFGLAGSVSWVVGAALGLCGGWRFVRAAYDLIRFRGLR